MNFNNKMSILVIILVTLSVLLVVDIVNATETETTKDGIKTIDNPFFTVSVAQQVHCVLNADNKNKDCDEIYTVIPKFNMPKGIADKIDTETGKPVYIMRTYSIPKEQTGNTYFDIKGKSIKMLTTFDDKVKNVKYYYTSDMEVYYEKETNITCFNGLDKSISDTQQRIDLCMANYQKVRYIGWKEMDTSTWVSDISSSKISIEPTVTNCSDIASAGNYSIDVGFANGESAVCININASYVNLTGNFQQVNYTYASGVFIKFPLSTTITQVEIRQMNVTCAGTGCNFLYMNPSTGGTFSKIYLYDSYINSSALQSLAITGGGGGCVSSLYIWRNDFHAKIADGSFGILSLNSPCYGYYEVINNSVVWDSAGGNNGGIDITNLGSATISGNTVIAGTSALSCYRLGTTIATYFNVDNNICHLNTTRNAALYCFYSAASYSNITNNKCWAKGGSGSATEVMIITNGVQNFFENNTQYAWGCGARGLNLLSLGSTEAKSFFNNNYFDQGTITCASASYTENYCISLSGSKNNKIWNSGCWKNDTSAHATGLILTAYPANNEFVNLTIVINQTSTARGAGAGIRQDSGINNYIYNSTIKRTTTANVDVLSVYMPSTSDGTLYIVNSIYAEKQVNISTATGKLYDQKYADVYVNFTNLNTGLVSMSSSAMTDSTTEAYCPTVSFGMTNSSGNSQKRLITDLYFDSNYKTETTPQNFTCVYNLSTSGLNELVGNLSSQRANINNYTYIIPVKPTAPPVLSYACHNTISGENTTLSLSIMDKAGNAVSAVTWTVEINNTNGSRYWSGTVAYGNGYVKTVLMNNTGSYIWYAMPSGGTVNLPITCGFNVFNSTSTASANINYSMLYNGTNETLMFGNLSDMLNWLKTINQTTSNINSTLPLIDVNISINATALDIWNYTLSNNQTAMWNIVNSGSEWYAFAILGIAFAFFYLAFNVGGDFKALQILFMMIGIYTIIFGFSFMMGLSNEAGMTDAYSLLSSGYNIMIYVMIFMIFYIVIMFIKNLLQGFRDNKAEADMDMT